jgi:transcriptional regulator with XRE-family HTH domain
MDTFKFATYKYVPQPALLEKYADRLPPISVSIARQMLAGKTQRDIADSMNMTQPSISMRLRSLCERISKLEKLPMLYAANFDRDLGRWLRPEEISILKDFWRGLSQMEMGRRRRLAQNSVR